MVAVSNVPRIGARNPSTAIRRLDRTAAALAVAADTTPAAANVINGAVTLSVSFTATPQTVQIAHKLGRKPRGWIVCRQFDAPFGAVEVSSDDRFLMLQNLGGPVYRAEIMVY